MTMLLTILVHTHVGPSDEFSAPDALLVDVRLEKARVAVKLHQVVNLPLDG